MKYLLTKKKLKTNELVIKIQLVLENNKKSDNILIDISDNRQNIFVYDINFKFRDNESYIIFRSFSNIFNLDIEQKYQLFKHFSKKKITMKEKCKI